MASLHISIPLLYSRKEKRRSLAGVDVEDGDELMQELPLSER